MWSPRPDPCSSPRPPPRARCSSRRETCTHWFSALTGGSTRAARGGRARSATATRAASPRSSGSTVLLTATSSTSPRAARTRSPCARMGHYSWGWGRHGQLGHGDTASAFAPRTVDGLASVHISEARAPPHPHGARRAHILPPRPLPPSSTCHQVSAGPTHSLARVSSTELYAFGRGASLTSASLDAREGGAAHADGGECRLLPVRVDELDDIPEPLIA